MRLLHEIDILVPGGYGSTLSHSNDHALLNAQQSPIAARDHDGAERP